MIPLDVNCEHTCNGLCNALDLIADREQETIALYDAYHAECSYADVRNLLAELVVAHRRAAELLERTRTAIRARCEVTGQIRDSFGE